MNVVEVVNGTRTAIDEELVARLVARVLEEEGVHGAEVAVTFVGERRIRDLNREHREQGRGHRRAQLPARGLGGRRPRDRRRRRAGAAEAVVAASLAPDLGEVAEAVLSGTAGPPLLLGDIVICARRALDQARADDLPPSLEVAVLLTHGALHLLGYDHETDAGQMALRQAEVLELVDWEGLVVAPSR